MLFGVAAATLFGLNLGGARSAQELAPGVTVAPPVTLGEPAAVAQATEAQPKPNLESPVTTSPSIIAPGSSWNWPHSPRAVFTPNMYGDVIGNRALIASRFIPGTASTPAIPGTPGTAVSTRQ